ncbi:MAG: hypothetical protein A2418_03070 [Candidatus Brennerbacteria bacterium RIFOXYC1_FULL_41_11]|uniref:Uncharacterized protein n=1 Tax=Candidatus Brennerbacteria bacterium RIFOXYD1_FULL_41_16 TaxID=1797529 RepID=A0A1G1XMP8_9BACT|nr:MAG: hypothetical protein A2391_00675 [Candidatus Brennerbacteria bacterium RIFOXYB1_FULL_41_13]OGY39815.1 MAG: hypothetical protein A2418_03070 [Candidatus Brennerbacteria bacterium RIFOXYC1_FULL_41_11]OGY40587.1 MAG: hypothetical protein A2570_02530 [Candidatus Brennerbacteria bacterium RIFOXYD1_FULL_41_16]
MISFVFKQIFHEITCFFRRWYLERSEQFWSAIFYFFRSLDKTLAIEINVRLWLKPLFNDYSPVGRVIGPIFRTLRIVFGGSIYAIVFIFAGLIWLAWLLFLPVFLFFIFR